MSSEALSQFEGLSAKDLARLTELLDAYIRSMEQGCPLSREQLIALDPDLADRLGPYLESLDFLQDAAAGFCSLKWSPESDDADALPTPKQIGDFRILREVGRGGMGVVYEAWQISLDRRVALKVLPFAALLDSKQIARFRNEARAAAQLQHPHIVPVFAVGVERGAHYYAMQFVDGQPLDRAIAELRRGSVPGTPHSVLSAEHSKSSRSYFRLVARLGQQAAEAVHAAHEYGIVHRDIKPSNLLLDGEGKLWVADFGLARCRWETNLTRTGDFLGTMRYMSPEQTQGQSQLVDHRTDIYSLGVTLYELLTLRRAIRGSDAVTICRELERDEPYPPRLWNAEIPLDLETIIQKAIAKSPSERYTTAQELADDLGRFLEGKPTFARRPTLVERGTKLVPPHKRMVASAAGVLTAAMIGLTIATVLLARQKDQTEQALQEARESFRQYRAQLAVSSQHLAMLENANGNAQLAEASFLKARQLLRASLREKPNDKRLLHDLAATLNNLTFLYARSDKRKADEFHTETLRTHERLVELAPNNDAYQRELAQTCSNAGSFRSAQGYAAEGMELFRRSIALLDRLHKSVPKDAAVTRDLAISYNNLGMLQLSQGLLNPAEQSFRHALAALDPVAAVETTAPADLSSLGGVWNNLGMVLEKQQRWDDAAESYAQAVEHQRTACRQAPQVARFRDYLSKHYYNYGRVLRRLQRSPQAIEAALARWELWRGDPQRLVSVADELASVTRAAEQSSAARSAKLAIAALKEAVDLGLDPAPAIQKSEALLALRDHHPEIEAWLAGVEPSHPAEKQP